MKASVIHHSLDLLIRLIDTTTGFEIEEKDVHFYEDDKELFPRRKGLGMYIFINQPRFDFECKIKVYGYEPAAVKICYEDMDSMIPIREIFLIPSENGSRGEPVISFTGRLPGISAIEAVGLENTGISISEFDERKRIMKLFRTRQQNTENLYYGLVHMESQTYEKLEVEKTLPGPALKIKEPLKEKFSINSPIARVIFGSADQDGNYLIRVRDNREDLRFIVRYIVNGEVRFRTVNFKSPEERQLD